MPKRKSKKGKKRKVKYEKGVPSKYLSGSRNKKTKAAEIKRTSNAYKEGRYIDLKKVQKSREYYSLLGNSKSNHARSIYGA